ncbi:hypothetical protein N7492_009725 [Penicillium capsulatum]|uniref:Uncharacterized protein n=1 Tax=Penicillium capsulatum TaxID=69766 RepID=A0A9W9HPE3_9EURO|nr:hypothetical protein N7492_009725 [Penicillium capsulatum]KAJ6114193.1 hypothetical protein N7512_007638 [Penicillium capsulatum]
MAREKRTGKSQTAGAKKNSNAPKAQKSARDIQTPASDREGTANFAHNTGSGEHRKNNFSRSPTRIGDFAPGENDDNESHYETDPDQADASEQDVPMEHQPDPISPWVNDVIQRETHKGLATEVELFFTAAEPKYEECTAFFAGLNQQIREANAKNGVTNIDAGTIPEHQYSALCRTWREAHLRAKDRGATEEAWEAFNKTHELLRLFNERHHLPESWNISENWAKREIGTTNPKNAKGTNTDFPSDNAKGTNTNFPSDSDDSQPDPTGQLSASEDSSAESDINADNKPTGLDALEAKTMKAQRQLTSAKVLYWWPKGTGSQIFVRYGGSSTPIYRIRAGSHESYNPSRVERVLTTKTRGTAKVTGIKNGLPTEYWKYERKHVEDLLGVGWKVEGDDENNTDALAALRPEKGAYYPQTRTLVKWKDGEYTLEGRAFIRRITSGSALDGDKILYQKAYDLESAYRKKYGLDEFEDDIDEDSERERHRSSRSGYRRRHQSEPAGHPIPRRNKTRNQISYETSDEDDTESDASVSSRRAHNRRYRSEPARYSTHHRGERKPMSRKGNDNSDEIRMLERKIKQLKMGRR